MPLAQISGKRLDDNSTRPMNVHSVSLSAHSRKSAKSRPWNVVHACELAREVLPLVEGQLAVGMRPSLLTPGGFGLASSFADSGKREAAPISLLQMWNHVREWRKLLNDSGSESAEIIHAHSFAAGMAAVRSSSGVVYQLMQPVEKLAAANGNQDESSWLGRSFRVAEQFVLTRAAAVVVNRHRERLICLERGVNAENLFLIPQPIASHFLEPATNHKWLEEVTSGGPESVFFLVPGLPDLSSWEGRDALLRWMRVLSILRHEHANVTLLFLCDSHQAGRIREIAAACNLSTRIAVLAGEMRTQAIASADVVICDREHAEGGFALEAMARGRALLAADVEEHREITTDGRGCLWYRSASVADLARRASFLAGNSQFRRALASAAHEHCMATRSAEVVGAQYDAVYRVAFSKRKGRDNSTPKTQLIPLQVGS